MLLDHVCYCDRSPLEHKTRKEGSLTPGIPDILHKFHGSLLRARCGHIAHAVGFNKGPRAESNQSHSGPVSCWPRDTFAVWPWMRDLQNKVVGCVPLVQASLPSWTGGQRDVMPLMPTLLPLVTVCSPQAAKPRQPAEDLGGPQHLEGAQDWILPQSRLQGHRRPPPQQQRPWGLQSHHEAVTGKWRHLETILTREINQTHICKYCAVSLVIKEPVRQSKKLQNVQ